MKHNRRSIRLQGFDYSQAGAYFVTICAQNRECLFGEIVDGEMWLNDAGRVVQKCWDDILVHFPYVEMDECVVMPNHVHGIIAIVGARHAVPLRVSTWVEHPMWDGACHGSPPVEPAQAGACGFPGILHSPDLR